MKKLVPTRVERVEVDYVVHIELKSKDAASLEAFVGKINNFRQNLSKGGSYVLATVKEEGAT
jgi:hypothetical protein